MRLRGYLVDSDQVFRLGLAQLLSEHHEIEIVGMSNDLADLETALAQTNPDVLFIDPAANLYEFFQHCRVLTARCESPKIVILSGFLSPAALREMGSMPIYAYARKPLSRATLSGIIEPIKQGVGALCGVTSSVFNDEGNGESDNLPATDRVGALSERENQILLRTVNGRSAGDIATEFQISIKTAEWHRRNVLAKLGMTNIAQLTKFALRAGIIALD